ncbi:MAG: hypothetical protein GY929_08890 [Actinomycetia bacterium]|nr:hypothetical protein [Actinomycetes bacterium]
MKPISAVSLALLVAFGLIASSCGGSEPERDQAMVDALMDDLLDKEHPFTSDRAEAECVATRTYDAIGLERMTEAGMTVETPDPTDADLTEDERDAVNEALFDCVDLKAAFAASLVSDGVSADQAMCVADEFGDDGLREAMEQNLGEDESEPSQDFMVAFFTAVETCGVDLLG